MTTSDRDHLTPRTTAELVAMRDKASRAAAVHTAGLRFYMAELCTTRAAACAEMLAERS